MYQAANGPTDQAPDAGQPQGTVTQPTTFHADPVADTQGITTRTGIYALLVPVVTSLASMAFWPERHGSAGIIILSGARLAGTIGWEILIAGVVGGWLLHKGWRPQRTATEPFVPRDVLRGVGVWIMGVLAFWASALLWQAIAPGVVADAMAIRIVGQPSVDIVVLLSPINAVFEEFLWLGLGIAVLRRYGLGFAFVASVTLRTLLHIYQGPLALIAILPLGLVFTAYYVRTHRIWPVVLAHCLQDLLSLGLIVARLRGRGAV